MTTIKKYLEACARNENLELRANITLIGLIADYSMFDSFEDFWDRCKRGDWLLWMATTLHADSRLLVKAKVLCVNIVSHLMKDKRSANAVAAASRYANGEVALGELEKHHSDAYEAAAAAYAAAAFTSATHAAAHAAYAAYTVCADAAATDSNTAAYVAIAAAVDHQDAACSASSARAASLLQTANICREVLSKDVLEKVRQQKNEQKQLTANFFKP
jgi:hypothetical protein